MFRIHVRPLVNDSEIKVDGETFEEFQDYSNQLLFYISYLVEETIIPNSTFEKIKDCVESVTETPISYCPTIFDSVSCFDSTPPGTVQTTPCPRDHPLFNAESEFATKTCELDGHWWRHPESNRTWSGRYSKSATIIDWALNLIS